MCVGSDDQIHGWTFQFYPLHYQLYWTMTPLVNCDIFFCNGCTQQLQVLSLLALVQRHSDLGSQISDQEKKYKYIICLFQYSSKTCRASNLNFHFRDWISETSNYRNTLSIIDHFKLNKTIKRIFTFLGGGGGFLFCPNLSSLFSLKLFLESVSDKTTKK